MSTIVRFDGLFGELSLVSGRLRLLTPVFHRVSYPESVDDVFGDLSDLQGVLRCLLSVDTVEKTFDFEGDIGLILIPSLRAIQLCALPVI